jgi:lipid-A-disaccharide synthase-like uncharacterized protein
MAATAVHRSASGGGVRVARLADLSQQKRAIMDFLSLHLAHIVHALQQFHLTPWKAVGYLGTLMFTSRWFVQLYYTRKYKRVVMPLSFWWLSVFGSALLLAYFIVGKNDSVGILSNFFPVFVSVYNLIVHLRHHKNSVTGDTIA